MIALDDLTSILERSRDPLAPSARDSLLRSPDAPASMPILTLSRPDFLAIYEVRLARAENGEGPATQRLREYTDMLRNARNPDTLDEIGWASGDTFYVALLHESEILAVSAVARAVWHLRDQIIHLDQGTYQWVHIKTFGVGDGFDDVTLIKNTIVQPAYADNYQGSPPGQQAGGVHGPYRLDEIDPRAFTSVSGEDASSLIKTWADQTGAQSQPTQAALTSNVYALLAAADVVYRFPVLNEDSAHESSWVVGSTGFHEFITIERTEHRLNVIVASDD